MNPHAPLHPGGHGHAVVIGAGLAGLTAARALANFMDRVTVIERDRLARGPGRRRGLPQARHTHSLTTPAQHGLEQLFPGIVADLTRAGAVRVRMPADMLVLGPGGWLPRFDSGLSILSAGRDLTDSVVRDRLRADPRTAFLTGHEAVALQAGGNDTVTGVWVRGRDRQARGGWTPRRLIRADFVVDASGRGSHALRWLAELGYPPPPCTTATTATTRAGAVFTPPVGHVADWKSLLLMASPGNPRQGTLDPVEGGRWSVSIGCADGTAPPTDHAGLLRAARSLPHPLLHDLLEAATPLGPVYGSARTANRWHHYEKLRRWPDQFLVVGDALADLPPAPGHGMALAVQCALVLDHLLTAHGTAVGLGHRLRRALAHRIAPAWQASTAVPHTAPPDPARPPGLRTRLARRHTARIAAAATTDPHAATLLLLRHQTAAPPAAALRPAALRAALRTPRAPAPDPPSLTHGPRTRPRRPTAPDTPPTPTAGATGAGSVTAAGPAGSAPARPAVPPATAPAGERNRP
ncbi:2-polyprenyl-6-methoxyphenol hydroxylase-like FAD-dependent oxidoreductase [Streptomyces sp. 3330]|uniref:FAD-dependent oxidoreductase n=1 Tax=Streptomyces sp. 3330 TaxID=2817755 RepID=UPI00285F11E9|nr:FAD-dependent monooxygenase [Streptomyces sp. 3330]MDR6980676.1 2-polyprenyl-6-methoxyphenol hydroxylase-like FAD-dependent oxidoreductase [Streptomyces sp. 3330]